MSRCPTFTFNFSIMSKWLAKHISTKVSFKITITKRHVHIDIRWPWKWYQYFDLGIREDERSKIIFLPSFQLVTRLNSQNKNETSLLMYSDTLICINIIISNWHNSSFGSTKMNFLLYFSSLHDYWPPTTLIPLVHNSLTKWSDVKNVLISFSKYEKWKSVET